MQKRDAASDDEQEVEVEGEEVEEEFSDSGDEESEEEAPSGSDVEAGAWAACTGLVLRACSSGLRHMACHLSAALLCQGG